MQGERSYHRRRRPAGDRYPGVWYRLGPDGTKRFEVTWYDSEGRRRWRRVEGGLRDAVAAREELRGKTRRGERIGSSRVKFADVVDAYFESATNLRPRTREKYEDNLRLHVTPRFGRRPIASITEDDVARLVRDLAAGKGADGRRRRKLSAWTARGVLVPVSRVFAFALRRGLVARNPVAGLERGERPSAERRDLVVLSREEIGSLLDAAEGRWRLLFSVAVFTGLRIGELLGLRWGDVDLEAGVVRVRVQLTRPRTTPEGVRVGPESVEPKTRAARRDVVLMPALGRRLWAARLAAPPTLSRDEAFVFCSASGRPLDQANVRRALADALKGAAIERRVTMHELRHAFASVLIASGRDVVFVSRQLGHASPAITLGVYGHLFDAARHADETRQLLDREFGSLVRVGEEVTETAVRRPLCDARMAR